ncbi:hypothetical protein LTR97_008013 [Elasticomyces elasticus]|uniref:Uncharacterized protein n=1 Tax=Elasticomyces elasticus TaxID=574655 RepID=A0AAN8A0M8_9PEZI|nr:hypothetical protein LTR97_008013 [Elasticomyces elasticus]
MDTEQDCAFLRLPREMRNEIYTHASFDRVIVSDATPGLPLSTDDEEEQEEDEVDTENHEEDKDYDKPFVGMNNVMSLSLLQVNRQIYDEYTEYVQPRQQLFIKSMPEGALKNIRDLAIFVKWSAVLRSATDEQFPKFFAEHTSDELVAQEGIAWTPAKVLRDKLVAFLKVTRPLVHPTAKVCILFDFSGFPDPEDPFTWACLRDLPGNPEGLSATDVGHAFHQDTLYNLEHDTSFEWPEYGSLTVEGMLFMPLWCSMATNAEDVLESLRAWREGLTTDVVMPLYEMSADKCGVRLLRTSDEDNWQGFHTQIKSINWADEDELGDNAGGSEGNVKEV